MAAITIVSYTGVTAKANASKALANADSIASVVNIYAADSANSGFPADAAAINGYTTGYAKVPTGVTVAAGGVGALTGASSDTAKILYKNKGTTGGCIGYWDFTSGVNAIAYKYVGDAAAGSLLIASPTCT